MVVNTSIIVLEKRPCRESALLLRGISPDCGRLSLVVHGAQKLDGKTFPSADLFRELDVEFKDDGGGDLFTADRIELSAEFDAVAQNANGFRLAAKIADFLLKNMVPNLGLPYTYDAFRSVLAQLTAAQGEPGVWTLEQCAVVLKTTFLYENGLLPEGGGSAQNEFMENLVAAGVENSELPGCDPAYWRKLNLWLNALIEYHQLKR